MASGASIPDGINGANGEHTQQQMYAYTYDYKSQLQNAFFGTYQAGAYVRDAHQRFDEFGIAYDPNGNIQTLSRNAWQAPVMDSPQIDALTYEYYPKTNQLRRIRDAVTHPLQGKGTGKFGDLTTQPDTNYVYDALGRLVIDKSENYRIVYDAYDNVHEVRTLDAGKLIVSFFYDDGNYRVRKTSYNEDGSVERHTYYFRDNKGNTMGVYEQTASGSLTLKEQTLYSTDRFGTFYRADNRYAYELKDHLGNVRAVINRRVVDETDPPTDAQPILAYLADYYPFGWLMPDRKVLEYRYGYNDQETDPETGWQAYKFREYDARIARFFKVDPLTKKYPFWTPYQFAGNSPVKNRELEGAEPLESILSDFGEWLFPPGNAIDRIRQTPTSQDSKAFGRPLHDGKGLARANGVKKIVLGSAALGTAVATGGASGLVTGLGAVSTVYSADEIAGGATEIIFGDGSGSSNGYSYNPMERFLQSATSIDEGSNAYESGKYVTTALDLLTKFGSAARTISNAEDLSLEEAGGLVDIALSPFTTKPPETNTQAPPNPNGFFSKFLSKIQGGMSQ